MQWEQFLDLLTVAEVMLFIFGRLLMSGSASAPGAPGDLTCTPKCPAPGKKENLRDVPGLVVLTHSSFTLQFLLWDPAPTTHSFSVRLLRSLPCLLSPSILSIFFFQPNFFPLYRSPLLLLHHIHHQTLTSICCLPSISWLVIVFL